MPVSRNWRTRRSARAAGELSGAYRRAGGTAPRKAKLSPHLLEQPESLVPFLTVARFVEDAARAEGIEDLGLRIGMSSEPLPPGIFGRLMGQGHTLQEALEIAYRIWSSFNSGVYAWLTHGADQVHLHHRFLHGSEEDWAQFAAVALMQYLNLVRRVAGPGWRPTAIQVPMRKLPGQRDFPLVADTPIAFGHSIMTVTFSAALLQRPLPRAPVVRAEEGAAWERGKPAADLGGAVRQVITTLLPGGYPDVHLVAEAVRMSTRTLQRRLHEEGLSFAGMIAQAASPKHDVCSVTRRGRSSTSPSTSGTRIRRTSRVPSRAGPVRSRASSAGSWRPTTQTPSACSAPWAGEMAGRLTSAILRTTNEQRGSFLPHRPDGRCGAGAGRRGILLARRHAGVDVSLRGFAS